MIAYKQLVYSVIITTAMACTACHEPGGRDRSQNMIKPTPTVFTDSNTLAIDRSPMDMIYFPVDYPKEKMADASLTDPLARVIYSRPQRNGRILHMDQTKDIAAIDIPVSHNNPPAEYFTMQFQAATKGCHLIMQWGDIKAELPIAFN